MAEGRDAVRRAPRKPRPSEGQWALGYREPLNQAERTKRDDDGLNVRERIIERYSQQGFRSIDKADLRSRFRWWGLYTQRKQGLPAGATATAEPEELEDEFFMLRVRIAGGLLTSDQLRAIAFASERFGRDVADVTDRQNIQLHWIRIEDVPRIWEALERTGLTTCEACGDTPRNILGCALAGIDAGEILDATPQVELTHKRFVGDPSFSNLPRKYKTAISGCAQQCAQHEINDVAFVGVRHPKLGAGYDLWAGGGLSTSPMFAQRLGVFVEPGLVPDVWAAVTGTFRDYGYRRSRNHARLKFLIADWGPEKFRDVMQREYLRYELPEGVAPPVSVTSQRDHVGVFSQKDGRSYVGFAPRAGRIFGHQLRRVADLADEYASGSIRTTTQQKMVIVDVAPENVSSLVAALADEDLRVEASTFRRGTMACTGIEFCKLALTETKARAQWLYQELEERLPGFNEQVQININGCPNSCARFQVADIGLMGAVLPRPDGTRSDAFLVHLGGHLGENAGFGRKVRGVRVFGEDLADYVETLLRRYLARRNGHGSFAAYVNSLSNDDLREFASPDVHFAEKLRRS
ncbi:MAG: nitrite/sulfite reductase [Actinobacteria bacterium]|nr:nitrite/sulfite reductase [Actinomycetota bacterium]